MKDVYLALTSEAAYWGDGRIIALQASVLRPSMRDVWAGRVERVLKMPIAHLCDSAQREYLFTLSEQWMRWLGKRLNALHSEAGSSRYWRILLGYWTHTFLCVLFERYKRLAVARSVVGDALIAVMVPRPDSILDDTASFIQYLKTDRFNNLIYTDIAEIIWPQNQLVAIGSNCDGLNKTVHLLPEGGRSSLKSFAEGFRRWFGGKGIVTRSILASPATQALLALRSGTKIWPAFPDVAPIPPVETDPSIRASIRPELNNSDEFSKIVSILLPRYLPRVFVEGYRSAASLARATFGPFPNVIASANGWYHEQLFIFWAAQGVEQGTKLVGIQHGGNYGSSEYHPSERHELAICDRYLSWGWTTDSATRAEIVPCPAFKLVGRQAIGQRNGNSQILFGATHSHRYSVACSPSELLFDEYIDWQRRFCVSLPTKLIKKLRLRAHDEDLGWDLIARWREWMPSVRNETWRVPFLDSLKASKLYVCDHLSTTFIEALATNMPTILFWSEQTNPVRSSSKNAYQLLTDAGILYSTPEGAADAVRDVYDDVDAWWSSGSLQGARMQFLDRFGRTAPVCAAVREWIPALNV